MIDNITSGFKIADSIIGVIQKIAKNILGIKDKSKRKKELQRLIGLLQEVRISRTLNMGFVSYLKSSIEGFQSQKEEGFFNKKEIEVAVDQLGQNLKSLKRIIDEMAETSDKVLIYQNKSWTDLSIIINEREQLLNSFKNLSMDKENTNQIELFATKYLDMTNRLGKISNDISVYARELDELDRK